MWGLFVIDFSQNTERLHQVLFWKRLLLFVGNTVKWRISKKWWLQENKARKISPKVTILATATDSNPQPLSLWTITQPYSKIGQSSPVTVTKSSNMAPASIKEFLDIQATMECGFTAERVRDMIRTYNQS